jgi:hypothetical protein
VDFKGYLGEKRLFALLTNTYPRFVHRNGVQANIPSICDAWKAVVDGAFAPYYLPTGCPVVFDNNESEYA